MTTISKHERSRNDGSQPGGSQPGGSQPEGSQQGSSQPGGSGRLRSRALLGGLATTVVLSVLLVGCSASADRDSAAMSDAGGAAQPAALGEEGSGQGSADEAGAKDAENDGTARQVIQTGDVTMRTEDALATARAVVTHVESVGGRVDDRTEQASSEDTSASAKLVVRVPADKVSSTIDKLRAAGTVDSVHLTATDVTGASQDLDARIHSLELSIARMDALLAKATTSRAIIDAESALTERQSNLEQLQSERARLADQVSLSTLSIQIYGPDVAPPMATEGPGSFLDGLAVGWNSFVSSVKSVVIVVGVLLPWLAFAGALVAAWVAVRRSRRRSAPGTGRGASDAPTAPTPADPGTTTSP
jgi:hypothetical protein